MPPPFVAPPKPAPPPAGAPAPPVGLPAEPTAPAPGAPAPTPGAPAPDAPLTPSAPPLSDGSSCSVGVAQPASKMAKPTAESSSTSCSRFRLENAPGSVAIKQKLTLLAERPMALSARVFGQNRQRSEPSQTAKRPNCGRDEGPADISLRGVAATACSDQPAATPKAECSETRRVTIDPKQKRTRGATQRIAPRSDSGDAVGVAFAIEATANGDSLPLTCGRGPELATACRRGRACPFCRRRDRGRYESARTRRACDRPCSR